MEAGPTSPNVANPNLLAPCNRLGHYETISTVDENFNSRGLKITTPGLLLIFSYFQLSQSGNRLKQYTWLTICSGEMVEMSLFSNIKMQLKSDCKLTPPIEFLIKKWNKTQVNLFFLYRLLYFIIMNVSFW